MGSEELGAEFEAWFRGRWSTAMLAWQALVPTGQLIGVLGGMTFHTAAPGLPVKVEEWQAAGWNARLGYGDDPTMLVTDHLPRKRTKTKLRAASLALAKVAEECAPADCMDTEEARHLRLDMQGVAEMLREWADPVTMETANEVRHVHSTLLLVLVDISAKRRDLAAERQRVADRAAAEDRIAAKTAAKLAELRAPSILEQVLEDPKCVAIVVRLRKGPALQGELNKAVVAIAPNARSKEPRRRLVALGIVEQDRPRMPWRLTKAGEQMAQAERLMEHARRLCIGVR